MKAYIFGSIGNLQLAVEPETEVEHTYLSVFYSYGGVVSPYDSRWGDYGNSMQIWRNEKELKWRKEYERLQAIVHALTGLLRRVIAEKGCDPQKMLDDADACRKAGVCKIEDEEHPCVCPEYKICMHIHNAETFLREMKETENTEESEAEDVDES